MIGIKPGNVLCADDPEVGDCPGLIHIGTFGIKPGNVLCAADPEVGDCPGLMIEWKIENAISSLPAMAVSLRHGLMKTKPRQYGTGGRACGG